MNTRAITINPDAALARDDEADNMLETIRRAASDPTINVEKLERLLAINERLIADRRKTSFMASLARLQAKMPQLDKRGVITDYKTGEVRNKYAKLEDIDRAIRPVCAEEGFSFSFDSETTPQGIRFSCAMAHRDGHAETKTITLPTDNGAGRNGVQSVGSSTSYARRYLLGMHLHLVTRDEDDDGNGGDRPVTPEQAAELRKALAEVGGTGQRMLKWAKVDTIDAIPARLYESAMRMVEQQRQR